MIQHILSFRWLVLATYAVVLIISVLGASRLSIDPNNRVFFSQGHSHFKRLLQLEETFGSSTSLVFVIVSDAQLFYSKDLPEAIRWLTERAWSLERVVSVDSIANLPAVSGDGDDVLVEELLDVVCPVADAQTCQSSESHRLLRPNVLNRFSNEDLDAFAVVARVDFSPASAVDVLAIAESARSLQREFQARFPQLQLLLTGAVPMMDAFVDAAEKDASSLMLIAIAVLSIALYAFLGSLVATCVLVGLGVSSVLITLGLAGWYGLVLNTATATVPLIVFTLVVASAMHVFLHVVREPRLYSNEEVIAAVRVGVTANAVPVILTVATTAVGLLSMLTVTAPPIKQLGVLAAVGLSIGGVLALVVVPCVLSLLPRIKTSDNLFWVQGRMNRYAKWIERDRPSMIWLLVPYGMALVGLQKISFDEDFVRYFSGDSVFRQETEAITDRLSGPYHLDVVFDSGEALGVFEREALSTVRDFEAFASDLDGVRSVLSIRSILEDVVRSVDSSRTLDDSSSEEIAQYFLLYELSLGVGHSTRELVDSEQRRYRVSVLLGDVSMAKIRSIGAEIDSWAESRGLGPRIMVTGEGMPTAYLSKESIAEMSIGILVSIAISAILVGLYFRSARVSLTIVLATVIPICAAFGIWGWYDSNIGMAAVLVVATTIGVVVDDTIHLTYRFHDGLRNLDLSQWGATAYSVHKSGTAIFVNSLVLAGGLLILAGSEFRMNSTFGVCSALVILLALIYSLSVAPRLLVGQAGRHDEDPQ